jgi:hypothetical protein
MNNVKRWAGLSLVIIFLVITGCTGAASTPKSEPTNTLPPPTDTSVPASSPTTAPTATLMPIPTATLAPVSTTTLPGAVILPEVPTSTKAAGKNEFCPGALPARLKVGGFAYINPNPPISNRVHIGPGLGFVIKGLAPPGWVVQITDGPTCSAGQIWWRTQLLNSDLRGWIAEADNQQYWLVPRPEKGHCPPL